MQKIADKSQKQGTPFLDLVKNAEPNDVHIREIRPENKATVLTSLDKALKWYDENDTDDRVFFVHVKPPKPVAAAVKEIKLNTELEKSYFLNSAKLLLDNKDYVLARNIYSYVLKQNIREMAALKGLGFCFYHFGESVSAKKCFKAVWELYKDEESLLWLAVCHSHRHEDLAAESYFSLLNPNSKANSDLLFMFFKEFGNCLTRLGKLDLAKENYSKALALVPKSDIIHVNLGTLEYQRKNLELSFSHYQQALMLNPKNPRARCGMGLVLLENKAIREAEKQFLLTLDLDSQNTVALIQLAQLTDQKGDYQKIKIRLVRFLLNEPQNTEIRFLLATILYREGLWSSCDKELNFILHINPKHDQATHLKVEIAKNIHA